jgi:Uncharacterized protein conserved in bacteria
MKEVEQPRPLTLRTRFLARLVTTLARIIFGTVRLSVDWEPRLRELLREHGSIILVTWHGRTFIPILHFRGRGYVSIVSLSRDGDIQTRVLSNLGWRVVRGSTGRRGVQAAREVLTVLSEPGSVVAFTPDGPRGPVNVCQPGVAYFAQRSGKPILPAGITAYPRWQMRSWDRYLLPKPFSKAAWFFGEPIFVGPDDDLEDACRRVEASCRELEARAAAAVGDPEAELTAAAPPAA